MGRWWTSDHHFGHEKIIGYCARPFANADAMNRAMVERWNDVVADGDEVWILGDLVLGQLTVNLAAHVSRLKGHKVLVPGNHDACWKGQKKGPNQVAAYFDLGGIARIIDDPDPVELAGETVQLNHFPYEPGIPGPARQVRPVAAQRHRRLAAVWPHTREMAPRRQADQYRRGRLALRSGQRRHHL